MDKTFTDIRVTEVSYQNEKWWVTGSCKRKLCDTCKFKFECLTTTYMHYWVSREEFIALVEKTPESEHSRLKTMYDKVFNPKSSN